MALYLSNDGEVNLKSVFDALHSRSIQLAVPLVEERNMSFVVFDPEAEMEKNQWGIEEPRLRTMVDRKDMDLALVPLVAFADTGDRMGRGGGYYDRYFENDDTVLVGIAYDLQRQEPFATNPWDRRLDAVVTESGWTLCSDRSRDHFIKEVASNT